VKSYKNSKSFKAIRLAIIWFIDLFYPPFRKWIPIRTFRYVACGGTVTVAGLLAYFVSYNYLLQGDFLHLGPFTITRYIAAYIFSFCISFPLGFFLSKFVVFQASNLKGRIQLFRYGLLQFLNIFFNWCLLHFFVGFLGFWATPSQALTTVIIACFSYFYQRNVSFKIANQEAIFLIPEENEEEPA